MRLLQVTSIWDASGESAEAVAHWEVCLLLLCLLYGALPGIEE